MLVDDQVVRAARLAVVGGGGPGRLTPTFGPDAGAIQARLGAGEPIQEPELTTIQRLADALGVEPEALMSLPTE